MTHPLWKGVGQAMLLLALGGAVLWNAVPARSQSWGAPVWSDEFNGPTGTPIDSTKWTYDTGILNVNNEVEYYCSPNMPTGGCDPQNPNAFIDGRGNLIIQARKIGSSTAANSGSWTSARLKSQGLKEFSYGRVEARMSLPTVAPGVWPAFWALGANISSVDWPKCGEVDYMENVPASGGLGPTKIASSLHQAGTSGGIDRTANYTFASGDVTGFHTYGAIWSPNMIQFYVDDPANVFYVQTASDIGAGQTWGFNHSFFMLLNLAIGGESSWPGAFDATTPNPSVMTVDYVRIYRAAEVPPPAIGKPTAITVAAGATSENTSAVGVEEPVGSGRVYFACTTTAPNATCQVKTDDPLNPNTWDFSATANATVTVSITTTAHASMPPVIFAWRRLDIWPYALTAWAALLLLGLAPKRRGSVRRVASAAGAVLLLCGGLLMGCGSGMGSPPASSGGTPPGTYSISLNAYTLTGTETAPDATATIPLTVN